MNNLDQSLYLQSEEISEEGQKVLGNLELLPIEEVERELKTLRDEEKNFETTRRLEILDEQGTKKLKESIDASNGVLQVFIHPAHTENEKTELDLVDYPALQKLSNTIATEKNPPILVLEDERAMQANRLVFDSFGRIHNSETPIYLLPTLGRSGFVRLVDVKTPQMNDESVFVDQKAALQYAEAGMKTLSKYFEKLGVKTLSISGSSLEVDEKGLYRCVGSFITEFENANNELPHPISIKITDATHPHGRDELIKAGYNRFL